MTTVADPADQYFCRECAKSMLNADAEKTRLSATAIVALVSLIVVTTIVATKRSASPPSDPVLSEQNMLVPENDIGDDEPIVPEKPAGSGSYLDPESYSNPNAEKTIYVRNCLRSMQAGDDAGVLSQPPSTRIRLCEISFDSGV